MMNPMGVRRGVVLLLGLALLGCGKRPALPPRTDTGAEQKARDFFAALLNQDWAAAYALLDKESQASVTREKFGELALRYREQMGFEPTDVQVGATENGATASAIANFKGLSGTTVKQFKDGAFLQKNDSEWVVVLRPNFGKIAP
jgi:hypothetical protein